GGAARGEERVRARARRARGALLDSQGRGMRHGPEKRTRAGHELGRPHRGKGRAVQTDKGRTGVAGPTMTRQPPKRKFKRLFLAADLHGSEITFRKFLGAATFYDADALLIGGDLTAKSITPIVQQRDGRYQTRLAGGARDNLTEAELAPIEKAIADSGPYPVRMTE